jgi:hypothetical protein
MQAERAHCRTHGEIQKIDLRYWITEAKLSEDLVFNGENLFHFIAVRLYKLDLLISFFLPRDVYGNS